MSSKGVLQPIELRSSGVLRQDFAKQIFTSALRGNLFMIWGKPFRTWQPVKQICRWIKFLLSVFKPLGN